MKCPVCGNKSRVIATDSGRRRRECLNCRARWTTTEVNHRDAKRLHEARALAQKVLGV